MNRTIKRKIISKLKIVETGNFNAEDIELLLIYIRDKISGFHILKEIAHFVAHPDRDKGILCQDIDILYSKFKYMPIQGVDALDYNKIDQNVYTLLFNKGIEILSDQYLIESLGKNRECLIKYLDNNIYSKKCGVYSVKEGRVDEARNILKIIHHEPDPNRFMLSQKDIITEFVESITKICTEYNIKFVARNILKSQTKIMFCIFELLQDSMFLLHDGAVARGCIALSSHNELYQKEKNIKNLHFEFNAIIPIQRSYMVTGFIQSFVYVKHFSNSIMELIDSWSADNSYAELKRFQVMRNKKYSKGQLAIEIQVVDNLGS